MLHISESDQVWFPLQKLFLNVQVSPAYFGKQAQFIYGSFILRITSYWKSMLTPKYLSICSAIQAWEVFTRKNYLLCHGSACPCDLVFAPSSYILLDFLLEKPCPVVKCCAGKSVVVKIQRLLLAETGPVVRCELHNATRGLSWVISEEGLFQLCWLCKTVRTLTQVLFWELLLFLSQTEGKIRH